MTGQLYGSGPWYVYNDQRGEFLIRAEKNRGYYKAVPVGARYCTWTARLESAMAYKNPHSAKRWAGIVNGELGAKACRAVTAEMARCILEVRRLEAREKAKIRRL